MHTGKQYTAKEFLVWTRRAIYWLFFIATIPTVIYAVFDIKWIALPWVPIALIGTAAAFIVGFKNTQTYNRLWESRKIWGAIVNDSRSWGIMVKDFVNDPASAYKINDDHKRLVYRHIAWLTALRFQLRTPKSWENMDDVNSKEYKEHYPVPEWESNLEDELKPLLSEEDLAYVLKKSNRATQLLSLQSADLRRLKAKNEIADYPYVSLESCLKDFFAHQGKAERIKNFPYPSQFSSINLFFIHIFVTLLPFGLLAPFANIGTYGVWFTIPFSVVVGWVFVSLEQVGQHTANPFEGGPNDIPMAALSRTIEIDLREMLDETDIPPSLAPINHVLM
ncbi:multidrug transporter [Joostella atrarenae]|uniref:Multidrug transporter n=1 Tax=Joostella atrarenae TaxID=679257 RepID=A0ABS9J1G4_9FLAO|nr:bestrophin family ion channel [Joostella atrarenae]MCF8714262.1 multidrug transporter [Joostella atrarenae]